MEKVENEVLTLEGRKRLTLSLVDSVDGFSEESINLTIKGIKLKIVGEKLKIINFNKASGSFSCDGTVNEIKFGHKKVPLLKKIFK